MLRTTLRGACAGLVLMGTAGLAKAAEMTLDFPTWQAEEQGFGDWWKEVTAAFMEANPEIEIDLQQVQYKDFQNQLTVRFASGRPPEILELPTSGFGAFASQDWLSPLDERIKGTPIETDWSSLQSDLAWEGETQGVLLMGYGFMLFYNQELLDEAGVAVPTSFEEFRHAVAEASDRENGIYGLAAVTTEHPTLTLDFIRFIRWQGETLVKDGEYNLTDPGVVKAIENYRETVGGNAPLGNNSTIARQLFLEGKTAFLIDGPWMYSSVQEAQPEIRENLRMIRAPFSPTLGGASNSIHIPVGIDDASKDAVWSFIEFLAQPEWQRRYTVLTSAPASRKGVLTDEIIAEMPHLETINDAVIGAKPIVPAVKEIRAHSGEFFAITQRAALRVLSTDESVEQILLEAQEELERAIPLNG